MKHELKFGRGGWLPRSNKHALLIGRVAPWIWLGGLVLFVAWVLLGQ